MLAKQETGQVRNGGDFSWDKQGNKEMQRGLRHTFKRFQTESAGRTVMGSEESWTSPRIFCLSKWYHLLIWKQLGETSWGRFWNGA